MRFVIVGTGRCGTTFLRNILSRHPDCFVCSESYWHAVLLAKYGDSPAPASQLLADIESVRFNDGRSTLDANLRLIGTALPEFLGDITESLAGRMVDVKTVCSAIESEILRRTRKTIFADKTPHYGYHLAELRRLSPDLKVVHVVRDGRDCAVSMSQHGGYQLLAGIGVDNWTQVAAVADRLREPPLVTDLGAYLDMWARQATQISAAARTCPEAACLTVHYETMVAQPIRFLRHMVDFLQLRGDPDWLAAAAADVAAPPRPDAAIAAISPSQYALAALAAHGYG